MSWSQILAKNIALSSAEQKLLLEMMQAEDELESEALYLDGLCLTNQLKKRLAL
ncbi:hypothetical protein M1M86_01290 [Dehalococcoidales bacterium]|nr:hypothetical protein [Dehalococcoidales bacterium]MCL0094522.1 hypothetical protein [Dehalococcoidales bacterium]